METSVLVTRVLHSNHLSLVEADINNIKGLWPIQVLAKIEDFHVKISQKLGAFFIKKSPEFFRVPKPTYAETDENAFLPQLGKKLKELGYFAPNREKKTKKLGNHERSAIGNLKKGGHQNPFPQ